MKAKLVTVNNPDGTMAYVSLMPVTDDEFECLEPSGMALELDTKTLQLSHGDSESTLRYQHLQQYEQMLEAAEQRIAELEAVCREVVAALEVKQYYGDVSFSIPYIKGLNTGYTIHVDDESDADKLYTALRHLLDTLPPSE